MNAQEHKCALSQLHDLKWGPPQHVVNILVLKRLNTGLAWLHQLIFARSHQNSSRAVLFDSSIHLNTDHLLSLLNSTAPLTTTSLKTNAQPWLNSNTRELRQVRRKAEQKWKKDECGTQKMWPHYFSYVISYYKGQY